LDGGGYFHVFAVLLKRKGSPVPRVGLAAMENNLLSQPGIEPRSSRLEGTDISFELTVMGSLKYNVRRFLNQPLFIFVTETKDAHIKEN
jgi:hypothetical protein